VFHPRLTKVVPQVVRIKSKLEEGVHFGGFLAQHNFPEIGHLKFFKPEEAKVGKDLVQDSIVAVGRGRVAFE
jgi:hypothetical protein